MGAVVPAITSGLGTLGTAANIGGAALNAAQAIGGFAKDRQADNLALDQLRERNDLAAAQLAQDNALKEQEIAIKSAQDEEDRKDALRRAVARQRARFGASGLDSSGASGSSEAVLLGLLNKSQEDKTSQSALDSLRLQSLDNSEAQRGGLNLLQASQLAKKQKINSLF